MADILPNFRIANYGGYDQVVEIPQGYAHFISPELPIELRDQVRKTIDGLCRTQGKSGSVYNESQDGDYGAPRTNGYLIPLGAWDFAGSQLVPGWKAYTTTTTTTTQQHRNGRKMYRQASPQLPTLLGSLKYDVYGTYT